MVYHNMNYFLYYLVFLNIFSFFIYGIDKHNAVKKKWRISELFLYFLAVVGGVFGCILGMKTFRHKTRKLKFHLLNGAFLVIWIYFIIEIFFRRI